MFKLIIAVFILNAGNVIANENQYDNEYYDREDCVDIVLQDLVSDQLTEKEIKERLIVYCGEEIWKF